MVGFWKDLAIIPDWMYVQFYFCDVNVEVKLCPDFGTKDQVAYIREVEEVEVIDESSSIEGWDWDPYQRQLNLIVNGKFSVIEEKDLVTLVNQYVTAV